MIAPLRPQNEPIRTNRPPIAAIRIQVFSRLIPGAISLHAPWVVHLGSFPPSGGGNNPRQHHALTALSFEPRAPVQPTSVERSASFEKVPGSRKKNRSAAIETPTAPATRTGVRTGVVSVDGWKIICRATAR